VGAFLVGCGAAVKNTEHVQQRVPAAPPHRLLAKLVAAGHGVPVSGIRQTGHNTPTGRWSLNAVAASKWLCFALDIPRLAIGSTTCATRAQIAREKLLIYPGAEPAPGDKRGLAGYAVYGVASAKTKSVTLRLSDCTSIHVLLPRGRLFLQFVPAKKVAHGVVPTSVTAETVSRTIGGPLPTLGASPVGPCAAGGR